jgi:hypothetical protein
VEGSTDGVTWQVLATVDVGINPLRGIEAPGSMDLAPAAPLRHLRITPDRPVTIAEVLGHAAPLVEDWTAKAGTRSMFRRCPSRRPIRMRPIPPASIQRK